MDLSGLQYPAPTDSHAFERLTRRIFARRLAMPQLYGGPGQKQHGADIVASSLEGTVVIQCKLKDELAAEPDLRLSELREDARAARAKFGAGLRCFILATTAPHDTALQDCANALTEEFRGDQFDGREIEVQFHGWNELRVAIGEDPEIREDYLGESGVSKLSSKIDEHHDAMTAMMSEVLSRLPMAANSASPHLKRALERTKAKFESGKVRATLEDLNLLRDDEWADASVENRFVILTQLGSAHWALGERNVAAGLFVEASALLPDHKVGLANLAASLEVSGDHAGALSAAKRLLEIDPETDTGLLALIQAQEHIDPAPHPLDPVPEALRLTEEAYLGAIQVFRNRGDERWLSMAAKGVLAHPDSDLLRRMNADAVLHRLASGNGVHAGAFSATTPPWEEVSDACAVLEEEWGKHISQNPTNPDHSLGQNLAQLFRALHRIDDALSVLSRLGDDDDPEAKLTTFRGMLLATVNRRTEAQAVFETRLDAPANRVLACHICPDPTHVRHLLADGDWSNAAEADHMWRAILDLEARAELEPGFDPTPQLLEVAAEYPERMMPFLAICRFAKTGDIVDQSVARILGMAGPDTPFSDLLQAATWCREVDRLEEIVTLLDGRVSTSVDNPGLDMLVFALLNLGERAALKVVLDQVPELLASATKFLEYRAYAAFNAGEMAAAREHVEAFLAREPHNLRARLLWVQVLLRQQDEAPIDAWLEDPVESLDGGTNDKARLGHLLASRGQTERAQRFTYRLARANPDSKVAQERFFAVVLLNPVTSATPVVAPGTVFTLIDDKGGKQQHRLEGDADLPFDAMDLRPTSPLAIAAMGRKKGDEVRLPARLSSAPDKVFTLGEIVHVHAYYFNHMADVMPTRFDGPVMLHKFTIDPETGAGFDDVFNVVTTSGSDATHKVEEYCRTGVTIRLLTLGIHSDIIACYDGLTLMPSGMFVVGNGPDAAASGIILRNAKCGCLVDTLTAELIRRHDLLDIVTATLGPLAITQTTMDDFFERCERDRQFGALQSAGKLGSADGKPAIIQEYALQRDMARADRKASLAWVRANTRIVPAAGTAGLARQLRQRLPDEFHHVLIDDMLAAAEAGLPILSDDFGYRRLGQELGCLESLGLAAVLAAALEGGTIDHTEHVEKLGALAAAHHRTLPIRADDILEALRIDGDEPGRLTRALIAQLGGPGANMRSHLMVATSMLNQVWAEVRYNCYRLQLIFLVADRLLETARSSRARFGEAALRDPDNAVTILAHYVAHLSTEPGPQSDAA